MELKEEASQICTFFFKNNGHLESLSLCASAPGFPDHPAPQYCWVALRRSKGTSSTEDSTQAVRLSLWAALFSPTLRPETRKQRVEGPQVSSGPCLSVCRCTHSPVAGTQVGGLHVCVPASVQLSLAVFTIGPFFPITQCGLLGELLQLELRRHMSEALLESKLARLLQEGNMEAA